MPAPLPPLPAGYADRMPRHAEAGAAALVPVGADHAGRPAFLAADAAEAWRRLRAAAAEEGLALLLVSAFRSHARQEQIVRRKLEQGLPWDEILEVSAYPGFSEHHTGRAVDVGTAESVDLTGAFERTAEFRWLARHAAAFGFRMSYPRDNPAGIQYEPWHWAYHGPAPEPSA